MRLKRERTAGSSIRASRAAEQTDESVYTGQPARPRAPRPPARPGLGWLPRRGEAVQRRHVPLHELLAPARGLQPEPDDLGGARGLHPRERRQPRLPRHASSPDRCSRTTTSSSRASSSRASSGRSSPWSRSPATCPRPAYLLSQEELIAGLEVALEEFSYGAYRTYQVPVRRIEERRASRSARCRTADPLGRARGRPRRRDRDFDEIGSKRLRRSARASGRVAAAKDRLHSEHAQPAGERDHRAFGSDPAQVEPEILRVELQRCTEPNGWRSARRTMRSRAAAPC